MIVKVFGWWETGSVAVLTSLVDSAIDAAMSILILLAVEGGLTAAEILDRTRGSIGWAAFYGVFVLAAAIHAPIGLRNVIREHTSWRGEVVDKAMIGLGILLFMLGGRAVLAVVVG